MGGKRLYPIKTGVCKQCYSNFEIRRRSDRRHDQEFCSNLCYHQWQENQTYLKFGHRIYDLYVIDKLSITKISEKIKVSHRVVRNILLRFEVVLNSAGSFKRKSQTMKNGYKVIEAPGHPRAFDNTKYYEHLVVLESRLGRYLNKNELGHHINLDKLDNSPNNIDVMLNKKEHAEVHNQLNLVVSELIKKGTIMYDRRTKTYRCA